MSVRPISESIANVPCGPGQCNGLWQKDTSITRVQCWTPAIGGHSTVPGIRSTKCQSCTNGWIFDAPFGTEQAGQCQAPILVVACYIYPLTLSWETQPGGHESSTPLRGALSHEVENRSWLIDLRKSYSFICPPIPWPGELSPSANPKITTILFVSGTIGSIPVSMWVPGLFLMKPGTHIQDIMSCRNTSPSLTAEAPGWSLTSCI